jgi:D-alanyl-D-alanine carboxypeptidase
MNNWPHQSDVDAFYGDPRGANGEASVKWESQNLARVPAPWKLITSWDFRPVSAIRIHKKCEPSLIKVLDTIWNAAGQRESKIKEWGMHLYAGAYNFRLMRGGTKLSMHSWACAVDFDSARNAFGDTTPNFATIPAVLDAFASEGWTWGGQWKKPDGMHWQAADV